MQQLALDILCPFSLDFFPCGKNDKISLFYPRGTDSTVPLTQQALGAVALYGTADLFADRQSHAVEIFLLRVGVSQSLCGKIAQNVNCRQLANGTLTLGKRLIVR